MSFSPVWYLLEQEGYLARSCLCSGLTLLRSANLGDRKGQFYSAFFELSIGLERMMKLLIVLDYLADNQCKGPSEKLLMGYGHKLLKLWGAIQDLANKHGIESIVVLNNDPNVIRILEFLAAFAKADGRYANINSLASKPNSGVTDPLAVWGGILKDLFERHASSKQRKTANDIYVEADAVLGNAAINYIGDLGNKAMSVAELHRQAFVIDVSSQYAVLALTRLIEAVRGLIEIVNDAARRTEETLNCREPIVPHMNEFFNFAWSDRSVLKKKRWP